MTPNWPGQLILKRQFTKKKNPYSLKFHFYDFLYSAEHKNKLFWSVFFFVGPDNESQQGLCGFEPHWLLLYWQKQFMFMFCRKRKVIQVGTTKLSLRTVGTSRTGSGFDSTLNLVQRELRRAFTWGVLLVEELVWGIMGAAFSLSHLH